MYSPALEQHPLKREIFAALDQVEQAFRKFEAEDPWSLDVQLLPKMPHNRISETSTSKEQQVTSSDPQAAALMQAAGNDYADKLLQIWSQALTKAAKFRSQDLLFDGNPSLAAKREKFLKEDSQAQQFTDSLATLTARLANAGKTERVGKVNQGAVIKEIKAALPAARDLYGAEHPFVRRLLAKIS